MSIQENIQRSRSLVHEMLNMYKNGVESSIGLRRKICNEVKLEEKAMGKTPRLKSIDADNFLPKTEKWELRARELLSYRITNSIMKQRNKATLIANYQTRMEEFDKAFTIIKNSDSCTRLDEIIYTFDRIQDKTEDVLNKEYVVGNETANIEGENNVLRESNKEIADM